MNTELVPSSDNQYANCLANLSAKLPAYAAALGTTPMEATTLASDAAAMRLALTDAADKQAAARSATQAKLSARRATEKRVRGLIKRMKGSANYTEAIGQALCIAGNATRPGVNGPTSLASAEGARMTSKPALNVSIASDGSVNVKFSKQGHTGVLIYGRRSSQGPFVLLAKQIRSPYSDTRANLLAADPEMREYMGQYFTEDVPVGQMSDVAAVTVPGSRTAGTPDAGAIVAKTGELVVVPQKVA